MNRSNFEHVAYALLLQGGAWLIFGSWEIGAAFAVGAFLFREHAQREYHIGDPSRLIGYEAFDFWRWSRDALLDFLCPSAAVLGVVVISRHAGNWWGGG